MNITLLLLLHEKQRLSLHTNLAVNVLYRFIFYFEGQYIFRVLRIYYAFLFLHRDQFFNSSI